MASPTERLRRGLSSAYLSACTADMALADLIDLATGDQQAEVRRLASLTNQLRACLRAMLDGKPTDPTAYPATPGWKPTRRPVDLTPLPPHPTLEQVVAKQAFTCDTCNGAGWVMPYLLAGERTRENCPDCRGSGLVGPCDTPPGARPGRCG